jgi:hypothetical protein
MRIPRWAREHRRSPRETTRLYDTARMHAARASIDKAWRYLQPAFKAVGDGRRNA